MSKLNDSKKRKSPKNFRPQIAVRARKVLGLKTEKVRQNFDFEAEVAGIKKSPVDLALVQGVNVLGWLSGEFGIAESSRAFVQALQTTDIPFALNNMASSSRDFSTLNEEFRRDNPFNTNLINITPSFLAPIFQSQGAAYFRNRYNIGVWYCETPDLPEHWHSCFDLCDEVWTPSHFCATIFARHAPVPVVKITYPFQPISHLAASSSTRFRRGALGIEDDDFVFLFVFDFRSGDKRKNPRALIEAFRHAFEKSNRTHGERKAVLVLKTLHREMAPESLAELEEIARDLRVIWIHEHVMRNELLSLFHDCDCYVSLHRAEGLGLGMAEAMSLGKPVIATAYSGNMEFMNVNNSFLVRYDLVELKEDYGPYKSGDVWAEADVEHAALQMREVFDHRKRAQHIGQRAAQDIKLQFDAMKTGAEIRTRMDILAKTRR